jgi:hypothetical protein
MKSLFESLGWLESMSKHVYILGGGDSGNQLETPEPGAEIWGNNNCFEHFSVKWTRWFEIHPFNLRDGTWLRKGQETFRSLKINDYIARIDALSVPVYSQTPSPFKNALSLPDLSSFRPFFTNSISYMVAVALLEKFTHLHLYGIDMASSGEYRDQKASLTYFLGLAEGRGVKIDIAKGSPILETDVQYGFGKSKFSMWDQRVKAMRSYIQSELASHQSLIDQYKGSLKALETMEDFYTQLTKP